MHDVTRNALSWMLTVAIVLLHSPASSAQQEPTMAPKSTVPLIEALREGDLSGAHKLLRSGARSDVVDNYGDTPLLQAIRSGYTDFAEELLSSGADPRFPDGSSSSLIVAAWY